ncbi:MAG: nucleoside-triphosphatase [Salinivirgaceae bacterium]|nr:nucleoside-triphosphatase [Salinivirgaceae bacterium]MDY0280659.1 nucleoside-triphosphatase [Salinivirgaceae bacterium]
MSNNPSLLWIKASIVGTIWAASEIVFGSFLHNLKIPFSGNILTAIGIVILISINYRWKERGLFWRAAIVCALMKTMSPSAIIFGPMIAILSQGFIIEITTRIIGRNAVGYIVSSIFSMLWNLLQKVINILLFYSMNIIDVYKSVTQFAEHQLNITTDITWIPIILLVCIYGIFGLFAGILGMKIGKKSNKINPSTLVMNSSAPLPMSKKSIPFNYSVYWLALNLFFIISSLTAIQILYPMLWISYTIVIAAIWISRYKRALQQLKKPLFWITFALITFISVTLSTQFQHSLSMLQGMIVGLQMNFRAVIIILGFSTLGTELYNPKIINIILKTRLKQLPIALKIAFDTLPHFIGALPNFKTILKEPNNTIAILLFQAEKQLKLITDNTLRPKIFIISGNINEGKTTFVKALIERFKKSETPIFGLYSEKQICNNSLEGYDIVSIPENVTAPFLRIKQTSESLNYGRFSIINDGLEYGREILRKAGTGSANIIIVDEIGKMEIENIGWAKEMENLINEQDKHLILTIRAKFVDAIIEKWKITNHTIFELHNTEPQTVFQYIQNQIK